MGDLVSVVLPVGPGVEEAGLALDDLLNQSWEHLEVLAVLNGCASKARVNFFEKVDERLRVIDHGDEPNLLRAFSTVIEASPNIS